MNGDTFPSAHPIRVQLRVIIAEEVTRAQKHIKRTRLLVDRLDAGKQ